MLMEYENLFLISLIITLVIESITVFFLAKYFYKNLHKDTIFVSLLASTLTLPYLWFIMPFYLTDYNTYIILGESVVILVEAVIYFKLLKVKMGQALVLSILANILSVIIGRLIL